MKNALNIMILLVTLGSMAQQTTPKGAFLEKWENSKNYLVEIAKAMPEEFYDFKPTEREMSFKEQLIHIQGNMEWLSTSYFSLEENKQGAEAEASNAKNEIIEALKASFNNVLISVENTNEDVLTDTVDFFAGQKSKLQILNLLQDHVTHHRGQMIVYLNLKNIEPPKYVGW